MLNRLVGMLSGKDNVVAPPPRAVPDKAVEPASKPADKAPSVMRREAMLGRDQRVAGYTLMLRRALDEQHDSTLPDVQRLYDETLLGNLQRMDIARLLGQRLAFVSIAPANLNHPLVDGWPASGTVWLLSTIGQSLVDGPLLARLNELKSRGFSFAVHADEVLRPEWHPLLTLADYVLMDVSSEDIPAITSQIAVVSKVAANNHIETYELSSKHKIKSIRLLIGVETAQGILNLREIASADKRLEAIIFGAEDYAASVGATRTKEATEVLYARLAVVAACAANDLQAIDIVYIDFKDMEGLRAEAEQGAGFGFSGKQIIHPNQVQVTQEAFTPSDSTIAYAKRVIASFESNQKEGKGAYALDGKMLDMPLIRNAQKVLDRARAAGKI